MCKPAIKLRVQCRGAGISAGGLQSFKLRVPKLWQLSVLGSCGTCACQAAINSESPFHLWLQASAGSVKILGHPGPDGDPSTGLCSRGASESLAVRRPLRVQAHARNRPCHPAAVRQTRAPPVPTRLEFLPTETVSRSARSPVSSLQGTMPGRLQRMKPGRASSTAT